VEPLHRGRTAEANGVYEVRLLGHPDPMLGFLKVYTLPSLLDPDRERRRRLLGRAANELRVLQKLGRLQGSIPESYVPVLLDRSGPDDARTWAVSEFCPAGDALDWAKSDAVLVTDLLNLMTDVLKALALADHVHGDIKPENILIYESAAGNMRFRLTDWETAVDNQDRRQEAVQQVTVEYAAPDRDPDCPTVYDDLYSLGATMWMLCTQRLVGELEGITKPAAPGTRPTEWIKSAKPQDAQRMWDLMWLGTYRRHGDIEGYYPLDEVVPAVPVALSKLIDRLLFYPAKERAGKARQQASTVIEQVLRQVQQIREEVAALEEERLEGMGRADFTRERHKLMVGGAAALSPEREVVVDVAWRRKYDTRTAAEVAELYVPAGDDDAHISSSDVSPTPDRHTPPAKPDGTSLAGAMTPDDAADDGGSEATASQRDLGRERRRLERERKRLEHEAKQKEKERKRLEREAQREEQGVPKSRGVLRRFRREDEGDGFLTDQLRERQEELEREAELTPHSTPDTD
jgi:hypothetical protein